MRIDHHLHRLRWEISWARFYEVFFAGLRWFIQGFLLILALDIFLHINFFGVRLFLFFLMLFWLFLKLKNHLKKPIYQDLSDTQLIQAFERRYPKIQDRWLAAWQFKSLGDKNHVAKRLDEEAQELASQIPLEPLVRWGPLKKLRRISLAWFFGFLILFCLFSPMQIAAGRLFQDASWPAKNRLDLTSIPQKVVRYEDFQIVVRPQSGARLAAETFVHLGIDSAKLQTLPLLRNGQGELFAQIQGLDRDFELTFEGGDFVSKPQLVEVVDRPFVQSLEVQGRYPQHIELPDLKLPANKSTYSFIRGGDLLVSLQANKNLLGAFWLAEQTRYPMTIEGRKAFVKIPLERTQSWQIVLKGEDGFENRPAQKVLLEVFEDQPPQITALIPKNDLNLLKSALLNVSGVVKDDFTVDRAELLLDRIDPRGTSKSEVMALDLIALPNGGSSFSYSLDFAQLWAQLGEVFKVQIQAYDRLGQVGLSRQVALTVVSQEVFGKELAEDLNQVRQLLNHAVVQQESVIQITNGLKAASKIVLPDLEVAMKTQNSLFPLIDKIFVQLGAVNQKMLSNRSERGDLRQVLSLIRKTLSNIKKKEMIQASEALKEVRESFSKINAALLIQDICLRRLVQLQGALEGTQGYAQIVDQFVKIRDLQREIKKTTDQLK